MSQLNTFSRSYLLSEQMHFLPIKPADLSVHNLPSDIQTPVGY